MYCGLHNHTQYSNITTGLDSINKLNDLVDEAKKLGMGGIAITNHDNLSEVIEINRKQKQLQKEEDSFKIAIGNEIYLVDSYDPSDNQREKYFHFLLVAKDKVGYQAIVELSSRAWYRSTIKRGKRRVPTLKSDIEEVMKTAKGHVVASTACLGGEFPTLINNGESEKALEFLSWCYEQFGKENFYIELQPSDSEDQIRFNKWVKNHFNMHDCIITTDAHYQKEEDYPVFEAFLRSQQEKREVFEYYKYARLMSEDEIISLMELSGLNVNDVAICLSNTNKIMFEVEFYDLAQTQVVPKVDVPEVEIEVPKELMEKDIDSGVYNFVQMAVYNDEIYSHYMGVVCVNELYKRGKWNETYLQRLNEEFDVFWSHSERLGQSLFSYFCGMKHFIDLAWSVDCAVGPSRGSASGSLSCWLMDIIQEDPIQYGLYFWRFLNKDRLELPDIDTDFAPSKKPALFAAIRSERDELGLTQVATFKTLTLKAAIGQAARGYRSKDYPNGLDPDISTYLSSLIEIRRGFVASLKQTLEGDEVTGYSINHSFIKECNAYPGLLDIIKKIEGLIVNSSTHASAVLLFDEDDKLTDHCSLMRAPNGDLCSSLDLHTCEEAGAIKYDFLLLSTLDIQSTCFKLLQAKGIVDPNLTLRECFMKYININKIDFNNPEIWEHLYNNDVLSIFQFDAASGRKGVLATHPHTLEEMTAVNGLIRLMTEEGQEDQIERFARIKSDPESFENEMVEHRVPEWMRNIIHREIDRFNGCCCTQESFMILSQELAGYTLKEANALRKTVAKKKMKEIEFQHQFWIDHLTEKGIDNDVIDYLWKLIIAPSLGYGFSYNHALPYSMVGVQCIMCGGVLFYPLYWQTACLLQRSGALDGKSADYNKVAKAVSQIVRQGVNIKPIDINESETDFALDEKEGVIHFGFAGVKGLKEKTINEIMENRPYNSFFDFLGRTSADVTSVVTLIKAGAFDRFDTRKNIIECFARYKSNQKEKLNGQNFGTLNNLGLFPNETEELEKGRKIYIFTKYLQDITKLYEGDDIDKETEYILDEAAMDFLDSIGYEHNGVSLNKQAWKCTYDLYLLPVKNYLKAHQEEMLEKVNNKIVSDWKEKYFPSDETESIWEINTMGLCFGEHPMAKVENITDFFSLSQEPEIASFYHTKQGRNVPLYKLDMIAGYVIAKDKLHSSITLLTPTGPVEVKFRKEQFASYDAQISKMVNGKKTIVERSWLNRGVGLIIHGMRQDDTFIAKTYKNSPMKHTAYKIVKLINNDTMFEVQKERKKGKAEEGEEEE